MRIGVTGAPGTGKTTFSKALSRLLKFEYVNLEDMIIAEKLYTGYDKSRGSYILDVEAAYKRVVELASPDTIYEGLSIAYLADESWLDKIVILRCNPYILEKRLIEKGFDINKVRENVATEILDIIPAEVYSRFDRRRAIQIDNSKDLERGLDKAYKFIVGEDIEDDFVNWLDLISVNNDINKFLS